MAETTDHIIQVSKSDIRLDSEADEITIHEFGRYKKTFKTEDDELGEVDVWKPEVAELLGRTCGISLRPAHCPRATAGTCPYYHVCKVWLKDEKERPCPAEGLEHDGLVHINPTCRVYRRNGSCKPEKGDCKFGHDHMCIRNHRNEVRKAEGYQFYREGTGWPQPTFTKVEIV